MREQAAVFVPVDQLVPWAGNPRRNDDAVDRIAEGIKRFGFASPIVARKANNEIIGGHTRWKAAMKLGLKKVPVRFLDLSEEEAHALAIADNKLGELAEWDDQKLREVLDELSSETLSSTGYAPDELERIFAGVKETAASIDLPDDLPDGGALKDPKGSVNETIVELRIPASAGKAVIEELRALVARYPSVSMGIA